jgi:hypothetical protein
MSWLDPFSLTETTATADSSFDTPRTQYTVPSDALQSSQPVDTSAPSEWGEFFRTTLGNLTSYAITRDAVRSGVTGPNQVTAAQMQPGALTARQQAALSPLLLLAIVGAIVLVAMKK